MVKLVVTYKILAVPRGFTILQVFIFFRGKRVDSVNDVREATPRNCNFISLLFLFNFVPNPSLTTQSVFYSQKLHHSPISYSQKPLYLLKSYKIKIYNIAKQKTSFRNKMSVNHVSYIRGEKME